MGAESEGDVKMTLISGLGTWGGGFCFENMPEKVSGALLCSISFS